MRTVCVCGFPVGAIELVRCIGVSSRVRIVTQTADDAERAFGGDLLGAAVVDAADPDAFVDADVVVMLGVLDRALVLRTLDKHAHVVSLWPLSADRSELMVYYRTAAIAGVRFVACPIPGGCVDTVTTRGAGAVCTLMSHGHDKWPADVALALIGMLADAPAEVLIPWPGLIMAVPRRVGRDAVRYAALTLVVHPTTAPIPSQISWAAQAVADPAAAPTLSEDAAVQARALSEAVRAAAAGRVGLVPAYRVYERGTTPDRVIALYRDQRRHQTHTRAMRLILKYCTGGNVRLTMWEALQRLRGIVDQSDPDVLTLANDAHALQTAAMLERDGLPEHMVAIGLVHDLGKIVATFGADDDGTSTDAQWAVVGDTFVTGWPIPDCVPFPEFNAENGDHAAGTREYAEGCGLDSVVCTMGHDEYLYRALVRNRARHSLPDECLYIARYHSLYAWHTGGAYTELESARDREMKPYVRRFQAADLYSKEDELHESWDDPKWRALVERVFGVETWDF